MASVPLGSERADTRSSGSTVPLELMLDAGDPGPKAFRFGTHRLVTPEETVARWESFMGAMGITRLANITGLDRIGIPVAVAYRPNSRALAVSQGKGLTLWAAKASALMESIESYHAERIELPLRLGSYEDMRQTAQVVGVTQLPKLSNSIYWPNLPLLWIEGYDLLQRECVWVPYEVVHTNYTLPLPAGSGCFQATSNGLASGNHALEAISYGICEVVERGSMSLWQAQGVEARRQSGIDLDTVDDPACREVLDMYERADIAVSAWEITTDVGISSFACMVEERTPDPLHPLYATTGMGCHPSRSVALLRALTEAAQVRLTLIAGSRDDVFRDQYDRARSSAAMRARRGENDAQDPPRDFADGPSWSGDTFRDDVVWELERLLSVGAERVIVVDLSKPGFGIPVVRVVIPGLEGVLTPDGGGPEPSYVPGARMRALLQEPA